MTTPAAAPTEAAVKPSDADMIESMFRALGCLVPGAVKGHPADREAETLAMLSHYGAADSDLGVIRTWLAGRQEASQ